MLKRSHCLRDPSFLAGERRTANIWPASRAREDFHRGWGRSIKTLGSILPSSLKAGCKETVVTQPDGNCVCCPVLIKVMLDMPQMALESCVVPVLFAVQAFQLEARACEASSLLARLAIHLLHWYMRHMATTYEQLCIPKRRCNLACFS